MDPVFIRNSDYSKYGTSVYQQLYGEAYNAGAAATAAAGELSRNSSLHPDQELDNDNVTIVSATSKIRQKYKSLIVSSKKFKSNYRQKRSSAHPKKTTGNNNNVIVRRSKPSETYKNIHDLPQEVLIHILTFLYDHPHGSSPSFNETLYFCLYVDKTFYKAAKQLLYYNPHLTSSYRVGQLVTSLRLYPENGKLIKILNLSKLKNGLVSATITTDDAAAVDTEQPVADAEEPQLQNVESQELNTSDGTTFVQVQKEDNTIDIVLATWRDWKHRNDPLYGLATMNSSPLKKINSTASLPPSSLTTTHTNSAPHNSTMTQSTSSTTFQRLRSNSSTSSISNSIISSFTSSLTPMTSILTSTSTGSPNNGLPSSINASQKDPYPKAGSIINKKQWLKYKLKFKNNDTPDIKKPAVKMASVTENVAEIASTADVSEKSTGNSNITSNNVTFAQDESLLKNIIQRHHPRANKFLAKYASYHDLPSGYILHLLNLCPNVTSIDFSNLVVSNDFYIKHVNKNSLINKAHNPSMSKFGHLTNPMCNVGNKNNLHQDSFIPVRSEYNLETVFLTDSSKSYEYFGNNLEKQNSQHTKSYHSPNHLTSNYPLPIDSSTKYREEYRKNVNSISSNYKLEKIKSDEIFQEIIKIESRSQILETIKMNNITWCREYMVKNFVLSLFLKNEDKEIDLSFTKSGLNRRVPWATTGNLRDLVALLILDELNQNDDLAVEDLFNIKKKTQAQRLKYKKADVLEDLVINSTGLFRINFGPGQYANEKFIDCKLTILKSENSTDISIKNVVDEAIGKPYTSLIVSFYAKDNISLVGGSSTQEFKNKPCKKADRITRELLSRIRELCGEELRRSMGENNYLLLN
ncbi:hypothetical protein TPHA_0L01610 [Tetrapisispora phaffii CBS 4417]|uniref:F-box domain-containing protein n=1 Tax=Tetrapisispora phaffii (strain ATCC 24235 / CBS 4417 / NBRC 1672 / NRRL Y-8282 / UCD 70-5) TaxID=1071381 RepID=G8C036_TETPH|nr:hypothetical protein TPHA_0L01610 [Tetrapisispora phaffii CBS 4417]CCE65514.1 hypothetical protein TPHA_0L01610 [Tetrapisispora phaffii CBS 4417]